MPVVRERYEQDGVPDWPARREAWNYFTDMLTRDGRITQHQRDTWTYPSIAAGPHRNPVDWLSPNPFRLPIPNTKPGPSSWASRFARPVLTGNPDDRRCPRGMEVQTLLFDRDDFTTKQAKRWAKDHDFRYGKVDTTDDYHRLRQREPSAFTSGSFRTITFGAPKEGIKAVVGCPKPGREEH